MYGTTGERILLEFDIDGHIMGSEITRSSSPLLHVTVGGTRPIEKIEIMKYSSSRGWECIHTVEPDSKISEFNYSDEEFKEDSLYYVRVIQAKGRELAWSSPIWVEKV